MYKVRNATKEDWNLIASMCEQFYGESPYVKFAEYDEQSTKESFYDMVQGGGSCILALHEDKAVGMLGFLVSPLPTNKNVIIGTELMWWVDPAHRKSVIANELVETAEMVAKIAYGCDVFAMSKLSTSPEFLGKWYIRKGYTEQDATYIKEL